MEETRIEIINPVKTRISLSGRARQEDGNFKIVWFDNTIKTINASEVEWMGYDMQQTIEQIRILTILNKGVILKINIKTI